MLFTDCDMLKLAAELGKQWIIQEPMNSMGDIPYDCNRSMLWHLAVVSVRVQTKSASLCSIDAVTGLTISGEPGRRTGRVISSAHAQRPT
jgi:hypothetical protein